MIAKKTVDTLGGVGSLLASLMCLGIGFWDQGLHHSIWKVWVCVFLVLLVNGIAMLKVAGRLPSAGKKMEARRP